MALPWGPDAYGNRKISKERTKNPHKAYTSTHAIRITADDMHWFAEQMRPGEKTHTTFHRLRMELARLENSYQHLKNTWIPGHRVPQITNGLELIEKLDNEDFKK